MAQCGIAEKEVYGANKDKNDIVDANCKHESTAQHNYSFGFAASGNSEVKMDLKSTAATTDTSRGTSSSASSSSASPDCSSCSSSNDACTLEELRIMEGEMESLHSSLLSLVEQAPIVVTTPCNNVPSAVTEDTLKVFRGRVARRILHYGPMLSEFHALCESLPDTKDREAMQRLHDQHVQNLQGHKSSLSRWWRATERQFHRLRVVALLRQQREAVNSPFGRETQKDVVMGLLDTRQMMKTEVNRMQTTAAALEDSSKQVAFSERLFGDYSTGLRTASVLLREVKKRAETDGRVLLAAFVFFCIVCGFILLKRTGSLRASIWIVQLLLSQIAWVASHLIGIVTSTLSFFSSSSSSSVSHSAVGLPVASAAVVPSMVLESRGHDKWMMDNVVKTDTGMLDDSRVPQFDEMLIK